MREAYNYEFSNNDMQLLYETANLSLVLASSKTKNKDMNETV